jgi:hypothetical protein
MLTKFAPGNDRGVVVQSDSMEAIVVRPVVAVSAECVRSPR